MGSRHGLLLFIAAPIFSVRRSRRFTLRLGGTLVDDYNAQRHYAIPMPVVQMELIFFDFECRRIFAHWAVFEAL